MRTLVDAGDFGTLVLDEPANQGGTGEGPSPLQAVVGALCGCEAVTFRRSATEVGLHYDGIAFEGAFSIDIRGRLGDRSVRTHFQSVRVRAIVSTSSSIDELAALIEETEARCPVFNLLRDASVDVQISWLRESNGDLTLVPRSPTTNKV